MKTPSPRTSRTRRSTTAARTAAPGERKVASRVRRSTRAKASTSPAVEDDAAGAAGPIDVEAIRVRAYEIFLSRGNAEGDALSDWLRAERELLGR